VTGLRWGIMGTGGIAGAMTETLHAVGSEVVAVGSARPGAPERFAAQWDIPLAVSSHRAVAEVGDVDIVYVATTNDLHHRNVLDCIELAKPVLCEKPIVLNARQASEMLRAASDAGVFVMEAMWMRFMPFLEQVDELINGGSIGDLRHVHATHSYPAPTDALRRWVSRELGGGSLLDLGIYPISFVHHLLGPPTDFEANAHVGPTGVDIETRVMSRHEDDTSASVMSSFSADLPNEAIVSGSEALLRIHAPFYHSPLVTVERRGDVVASFDTGYGGNGFRFEVAEAERCVSEGRTESGVRTHADTLAVMEWLDVVRDRCGVEFVADAT
jgi:predicted dehydrogenase